MSYKDTYEMKEVKEALAALLRHGDAQIDEEALALYDAMRAERDRYREFLRKIASLAGSDAWRASFSRLLAEDALDPCSEED